ASLTSDIIVASSLRIVTLRPSGATNQRLSAAGEGGSRVTTENPQPLFLQKRHLFSEINVY
ncbi:MAG: hypothetical protein ABJM43_01580, partial [Paracoccaceae bacterium]